MQSASLILGAHQNIFQLRHLSNTKPGFLNEEYGHINIFGKKGKQNISFMHVPYSFFGDKSGSLGIHRYLVCSVLFNMNICVSIFSSCGL